MMYCHKIYEVSIFCVMVGFKICTGLRTRMYFRPLFLVPLFTIVTHVLLLGSLVRSLGLPVLAVALGHLVLRDSTEEQVY